MSDFKLFALISCGLEVSNSYTQGCDQILKREQSRIRNALKKYKVWRWIMKGYKGLDLPKGQQWGVWMIWTLFPLEPNLISQT